MANFISRRYTVVYTPADCELKLGFSNESLTSIKKTSFIKRVARGFCNLRFKQQLGLVPANQQSAGGLLFATRLVIGVRVGPPLKLEK